MSPEKTKIIAAVELEAPSTRRRDPAQRRSRDRLDRILAVASNLVADKGSDKMRMSEVAERAEISIGSLYQYFPDKAAIIRTLAERINSDSRACIEAALAEAHDSATLERAYLGLVDQHYAMFLAEPVVRDIWSGTQADKELMALELTESKICSGLLAAAIERIEPRANPEAVAASALMIWQLCEATMRLAISLDRHEGDAIVAAFKRMTWQEISRYGSDAGHA